MRDHLLGYSQPDHLPLNLGLSHRQIAQAAAVVATPDPAIVAFERHAAPNPDGTVTHRMGKVFVTGSPYPLHWREYPEAADPLMRLMREKEQSMQLARKREQDAYNSMRDQLARDFQEQQNARLASALNVGIDSLQAGIANKLLGQ